jgi:hypothetical protein
MNWAVLIPAILAFLAAATAALQAYQSKSRIAEVHVLVNSQMTTVLNRVTQLTDALTKAGVAVPPEPGAPKQ